MRRERAARTGKASGKGEMKGGGAPAIRKSRDGVAADARAIEAMKREMDGVPTRSRFVTDEYRAGWDRTFGKRG